MSYAKNCTYLLWAMATVMALVWCGKPNDIADAGKGWLLSPKEVTFRNEASEALSGAKAIDYSLSNTGMVLKDFTPSEKTTLSGSSLSVLGKSLTGTMDTIQTKIILTDGKFSIEKTEGVGATAIKWTSWDGKLPNRKTYELKFVPGLTQMKVLWQKYAYDEKNVIIGEDYQIRVFLSGNIAYVIEFENLKEASKRNETYEEYRTKVEKIKAEHTGDPATINKLTKELNGAYDVRMEKLK